MRLIVEGHYLPGRTCGQYADVHVGVQVGREPADLVPADAETARWELEIEVVERDGEPDFSGPAVQGRRGDRFVYLTWGEGTGAEFTMFRRAKLRLADVPDPFAARVTARIHLTDEHGHARCARLTAPALEWV
ncbi:MAG: hypothetical protein JF565_12275 [Propionibacteriales bacterium]|nr:hypothetical protein [Propionibacteriales bacterium]